MTGNRKSSSASSVDFSTALFKMQEKILCFHGVLIYEGRVLQIKQEEKIFQYLIHYAGWNKSWDEWVPEHRVLKFNEENQQKAKDLKQAQEEALRGARKSAASAKFPTLGGKKKSLGSDTSSGNLSATNSRSSTPIFDQKGGKSVGKAESVDGDSTLKRRKKATEFVEPDNYFHVKQEIEIVLPEAIKTLLYDDWDHINRQKKLTVLPAKVTAESIIDSFLKTKKKPDQTASEFCKGLKVYFDILLADSLLYKCERSQYNELEKEVLDTKEDETDGEVYCHKYYGIVHLARLFTKLGQCLGYTPLDVEAVELIKKIIDDFFKFLIKNQAEYFNYETLFYAAQD